jgi:hypothetical protein
LLVACCEDQELFLVFSVPFSCDTVISKSEYIYASIIYKARTNNIHRTGSPHINSPGFGVEYILE